MNGEGAMDRRRFLVSIVTIGGGLGCGIAIGKPGAEWGGASVVVEVSKLLTDAPASQSVGRAYLDLVPDERDPDLLVDLIFPSLRDAESPPAADALLRRVVQDVRRDFEEDRLVRIDGWFLSRTEARLSALVAATA
jgi:hypothetical protein